MYSEPPYWKHGRRRHGGAGRIGALLALVVVALGAAGFWYVSRADDSGPGAASGSPSPGVSASGTVAADPSATTAATVTPAASATPAASSMPSPLPTSMPGGQPVPILVYHHVTPEKGGDRLLYVSPSQFERQLAYLRDHGYEAVTMREVYDAWAGKGALPRRPVVLTFDDGYVDQVRNAGAILRRFGWPGELALVFNILYKGSSAPATSLTPALVQRLVDDGWGIESHSVSHPDLRKLSADDLRHELEYSRKRLEQIYDVPVDFFCYPGGNHNGRVERAVHEAGYLAATTIKSGAATPSDLYALPRIFVYWGESVGTFGERIEDAVAEATK